MAGGYELVYRRLMGLCAWRFQWAKRAINETRLHEPTFKLLLIGNEPPQLRVSWTLAFNGPDGLITSDPLDVERLSYYDLLALIKKWFLHPKHLTEVAEKNQDLIRKTYPCKPHVAMYGRSKNERGGSQSSFDEWAHNWFYGQFMGDMIRQSSVLQNEMKSLMDQPAFKEKTAKVLEDLAVESLATSMIQYSKIPNVIERASKLFIVKDVMER